MKGVTLTTQCAGTITILDRRDWGKQGEIYDTSRADYLLKVCMPDDDKTADELAKIKKDMIKKYQTFSLLQFGKDKEVTCLPLEYCEVDYNGPTPAYLMRTAMGQQMQKNIKSLLGLSLPERLRIARSLANALNLLHGRQVIHSDFKPDNFFFDGSGLVQMLDIDGGGYFGTWPGTKQFWPDVPPTETLMGK